MSAPPIDARAPGRMAVRTGREMTDQMASGVVDGNGISVPPITDRTVVQLRIPGTTSTITIDMEQVLYRFIQDVMQEATGKYWRRRAAELDRIGTEWSSAAAAACRNHARLMEGEFGDVQ